MEKSTTRTYRPRATDLEILMFEIFTRKRLTESEIELRRIRHILEQMQNDAIARGVLLNAINSTLKESDNDDDTRSV